jgi:hypothetical protein
MLNVTKKTARDVNEKLANASEVGEVRRQPTS